MRKKGSIYGYRFRLILLLLLFLSAEQKEDMWKEAGPNNRYTLELPPFRRKRKKWIYWQVRALKPYGDLLTISEMSSFKLVYESTTDRK